LIIRCVDERIAARVAPPNDVIGGINAAVAIEIAWQAALEVCQHDVQRIEGAHSSVVHQERAATIAVDETLAACDVCEGAVETHRGG
jgi:hypothetical protein